MKKRLQVYWNDSPATITVSESKPVVLVRGGPTDEGYHREEQRYWIDEGEVFSVLATQGRDCDGRYSTYDRYQLIAGHWERLRSGQRDYSAELAGY